MIASPSSRPASPPHLAPPRLPGPIARELTGFERYRVDVGGVRMHVMERGRGTPVVCLHGNPTWGYLWRKVVARLDLDRFRVIVPDILGLGYSDRIPTREHTLELHARRFGACLDALGLERFVFAGQDWGGPIGLAACAERADRVRGLVVLNTVVSPPREGFRASAFHRFAHTPVVADAVFRLGLFPQAFLGMAQGDRRPLDAKTTFAYVAPLANPLTNNAPLALARMVPDSQRHPSLPALARAHAFVSSFRGPTAIVWGRRDPILGRVLGWIEKQLPHARVWRTDAGHFLQEEVPDEITAGIVHAAAA